MTEDRDPRIITPMPADLVKRVDEWRYENRVPSRSEAIRRLIERGLRADATPKP